MTKALTGCEHHPGDQSQRRQFAAKAGIQPLGHPLAAASLHLGKPLTHLTACRLRERRVAPVASGASDHRSRAGRSSLAPDSRASPKGRSQHLPPGRIHIEETAKCGRIAVNGLVFQQGLGHPRPTRQPGIDLLRLEGMAQHIPGLNRKNPAAPQAGENVGPERMIVQRRQQHQPRTFSSIRQRHQLLAHRDG